MKNKDNDIIDFVNKTDISVMTLQEIADHLNINIKTVGRCFKKYNIVKPIVNSKKRDKQLLISKMIDKDYTPSEIAKELNMSSRQIITFCNEHGIKNPNKSHNRYEFSNKEKQVILGSLLGDGHVDVSGRLRIKHSCAQNEYLMYKLSLFNKNIISSVRKDILRFDKRTNKSYCSSSFDTKCIKYLKEQHLKWYKNKKTINFEDFEILDILGLSIWFMDDGFKQNNGIGIATMCFELKDIHKIIDILYKKFNIQFGIKKDKCIYVKKDEYVKFDHLIRPYIIPSMLYKLQNN
jgi:DNA-binding CsgD family transcriptional regulator